MTKITVFWVFLNFEVKYLRDYWSHCSIKIFGSSLDLKELPKNFQCSLALFWQENWFFALWHPIYSTSKVVKKWSKNAPLFMSTQHFGTYIVPKDGFYPKPLYVETYLVLNCHQKNFDNKRMHSFLKNQEIRSHF